MARQEYSIGPGNGNDVSLQVSEVFRQFMNGAKELENLQKRSSQCLVDFQQHLEDFRKRPLSETSDVVARVAAMAPSARLTRYLDAGGTHEHTARQVVFKLDSSWKGLWNHIKQAQVLLADLDSCVNITTKCLQSEHSSPQESVEISTLEKEGDQNPEKDQQLAHPRSNESRLQTSDYVHMMSLILIMLVDDFNMQEKIVSALDFDSPSGALGTYCLMWTLRPFVDDEVVKQAMSWIEIIEGLQGRSHSG